MPTKRQEKDIQIKKKLILSVLVVVVLAEFLFAFRPIIKEVKYQVRSILIGSRDKLVVVSDLRQG